MLRALGRDPTTHLVRGYVSERSPDVLFVPEPGNTVVRWSGAGLGTDDADPSTTHPTPWDYHQRVPIMLWGPGFIRTGVRSDRSVDLTDLVPTFARLLRFGLNGPTIGEPLRESLAPPPGPPPRAIVLVAYDGGGWNLLERWPDAWPVQRRLAMDGTTYTNATIGSAPAVTSAIHANMGTGLYPDRHGLSEITARLPDGTVGDIYLEHADPRLLRAETIGDAWDAAHDNRPWVGMIGYESWHLGMMSHGAQREGGDRDVAVLWEQEPGLGEFFTNEEFYELPGYLPHETAFEDRLRDLDRTDGEIDGVWIDNDLRDPIIVPGTPAFVEHQGEALVRMVEREPIGEDGLTDLLFVEMKPTDFGGHIWNMVAPEEETVLRAQDRVLGDMIEALDRKVGRGRYVVAITADHGQTPLPEEVGGVRVHPDLLGQEVEEYFRRDLVDMVTPDGVYLDRTALEDAGISLEDVARFIGDFRYGDALPEDADVGAIAPGFRDDRVFTAALPGPTLGRLDAGEIRELGPGRHPEGDLTSPVPPASLSPN